MRDLSLITGLLLSATAFAQELTAPPVIPTEAAEAALLTDFFDQALKVDEKNKISQGRAQVPLTHREFFVMLERTDLIEKSDGLAMRRQWLVIGSVALSSAAIITGALLIATAPRLASAECESSVTVYNEFCVPRANAHNISGTVTIAAGVVGALLMAGFAYNSNPALLDRDETAALVSRYNSKLARQLRRPPASIRFLPMVTPDGASLAAALRF